MNYIENTECMIRDFLPYLLYNSFSGFIQSDTEKQQESFFFELFRDFGKTALDIEELFPGFQLRLFDSVFQ